MTKGTEKDVIDSEATVKDMTGRLFWEERASGYHLPFEEENLARTRRIISLMEQKGLPIRGARILDVGSGPGTFALPLALQGASATALDISENMLRRLAAEAQRLGIPGVQTMRASWKEIDPAATGLSGAFDIVLSALSIAIETEEDILKMEQCSRQWCVCIAAGKIWRDALCEKALRMLGAPLKHRPDICSIRERLEEMGRAFSYESFPFNTEEKKTIPELAEDVAKSLEIQGKTPDRPYILSTISSLFSDLGENGTTECTRRSNKGVLMWRIDNGDHERI